MRTIAFFLLLAFGVNAQFTMPSTGGKMGNPKIAVQNTILAKVNGTTISMMDVKKKMDLLFHQHYSHLADSTQARFQFYETSWRRVLSDMIDQELILADAADKEVKITDGEIREEVESRFGPNVMTTLDKIGLTFDEAWKLVKNEMIVMRMNWWFVQSKAISKVTPQEIRQGYRNYLQQNPAYTQWKYRVLSIQGPETIATELHAAISEQKITIDNLPGFLKSFEATHEGCSLSLSNEYESKDTELAQSHKTALANLMPGQFGEPTTQVTRDKKKVSRIFYLSDKLDHTAPTFEEMSPMIKNELLQKASGDVSINYLGKLRKHYRFDADHLKETLPEDLHPFALQ